MVKSAKDRIEKYAQNLDPKVTERYLEAQKSSMIKKETHYLINISALEGKVKGLLQKEGVLPFQIPNYLFFARQLYRITNISTGQSALNEANLSLYKWVQRGLKTTILLKIGLLFGLSLTMPPIAILTGNAEIEDVLKNKTFYNTDPLNKLSGTLELTGDANLDDVILNRTFYKDDPLNKLTGTLELTGNAQPLDVEGNKTFYNTDPKTKLTGTIPIAPFSPTLIDSFTTLNATTYIQDVHPSSSAYVSGLAQSFMSPAQGFMLHSIHWQLSRSNLPEIYRSRLYVHEGTYGVSSIPKETNMLAESDSLNASHLSGTAAWIPFFFSGKQRVVLPQSTPLVMALIAKSGVWDTTNYILLRISSVGGHNGNRANFVNNAWSPIAAHDLGFRLYGIPI